MCLTACIGRIHELSDCSTRITEEYIVCNTRIFSIRYSVLDDLVSQLGPQVTESTNRHSPELAASVAESMSTAARSYRPPRTSSFLVRLPRRAVAAAQLDTAGASTACVVYANQLSSYGSARCFERPPILVRSTGATRHFLFWVPTTRKHSCEHRS